MATLTKRSCWHKECTWTHTLNFKCCNSSSNSYRLLAMGELGDREGKGGVSDRAHICHVRIADKCAHVRICTRK